MSAEQRAKGESMRAKYARVFDVDINLVKMLCLENGDVQVWHAFLCGPDWPVWSLGGVGETPSGGVKP